jgi:hypothetical protein
MNNLLKPKKILWYMKNQKVRIIKNKQQFIQEYLGKSAFE